MTTQYARVMRKHYTHFMQEKRHQTRILKVLSVKRSVHK